MSTLASIASQITRLIAKGNVKTGREDVDLTSSYNALLAGYNVDDSFIPPKEFSFKITARTNTNSGDTFTKYTYTDCTDIDVSHYSMVKVTLSGTNANSYYIKVNDITFTNSGTLDISGIDTLTFDIYGVNSAVGAETLYVIYEVTLIP